METQMLDQRRTRDRRAACVMFGCFIVLLIGNIVLAITAMESFRNERALSAELDKLHLAQFKANLSQPLSQPKSKP